MTTKHPQLFEWHNWYKSHQDEIATQYGGRYIVIADNSVVADFTTEDAALNETLKDRKMGTFLLKLCLPAANEPVKKFRNVFFP